MCKLLDDNNNNILLDITKDKIKQRTKNSLGTKSKKEAASPGFEPGSPRITELISFLAAREDGW